MTVFIRDPQHGQPGFDDEQRVAIRVGPDDAVLRGVGAPESPGRVHRDSLARLEEEGEELPQPDRVLVGVRPNAAFAEEDRVDSSAGQVVKLVVAAVGPRTHARRGRIDDSVFRMGVIPPVASPPVEHAVPYVTVAPDRLVEAAHLVSVRVDADDHPPGVIVHPQQRVAGEENAVGLGDLAGPLALSCDRAQVPALGIVRPHFGGLVVQDIDGAVTRRLDSADVAEDQVRVVAFEAAEPQIHLRFDDLRHGVVDGWEVRVPHEKRAVRERLAQGKGVGGVTGAGGSSGGGGEDEECARHGLFPPGSGTALSGIGAGVGAARLPVVWTEADVASRESGRGRRRSCSGGMASVVMRIHYHYDWGRSSCPPRSCPEATS